MGCSVSSNRSHKNHSSVLISKLAPSIQRTQSTLHLSSSFSRQHSFKSKCLKLRLSSPVRLLSKTLNYSNTQFSLKGLKYLIAFNHIKETFLKFVSKSLHFYTQVHEVCFSNFEVQDGIFIMLISLFANIDLSVNFSSDFPFIIVKGTMIDETAEIFNTWTEFIQGIENLVKNKTIQQSMERLKEFVQVLHEEMELTLRPRKINKLISNCECAIQACEALLQETKKLKQNISRFFRNIKEKTVDLKRYSNKAAEFQLYTGERIIHCLLLN